MSSLVASLRHSAQIDATEGEYNVKEHIEWMAADMIEALSVPVDLLDEFQQTTFEWSLHTFGVRGPAGPINHLKSECDEILEDPTDIEEFADAWLLLQDAAARGGFKMSELFIAATLKHGKNTRRDWPPRGQTNEQGFTEHSK